MEVSSLTGVGALPVNATVPVTEPRVAGSKGLVGTGRSLQPSRPEAVAAINVIVKKLK